MQHSVLVVDDDAEIRNALQLVLKKAGYHPILAEGGQAAIDADGTGEPGRGRRRSSLRFGNARDGWSRPSSPISTGTILLIPIVVLSGASPTQFLDAVGKQGVGDWIRKPATNETVLEKVRGAVHLFELRRAVMDRKTAQRPNPPSEAGGQTVKCCANGDVPWYQERL